MSLSSSTDYAEPRIRTRTRKPAFKIEMPAATKGKFYAALKRGTTYHLGGGHEIIFRKGVVKEVSEEVYLHLASNAYDVLSHNDPDVGRVRRKMRKFQFSPELPEELEVTYPDLVGGEA